MLRSYARHGLQPGAFQGVEVSGVRRVSVRRPSGQPCSSLPRSRIWRDGHLASRGAQATLTTEPEAGVSESDSPEMEVIVLDSEWGTHSVQGTLSTSMAPDDVYGILTDHANCHKVFRSIEDCTVETNEAGERVLHQKCRWEFFAFHGTFQVLMDVNEDAKTRVLECKMLNKGFMQRLHGRWQVHDREDGVCHVEYVLSVKPLISPPPPFSAGRIFAAQMKQILEDLHLKIVAQTNV